MQLLKRLFPFEDSALLKEAGKIVPKVQVFESSLQTLSYEALAGNTI
jgi:hypothetical protein